MLTRFVIGWFLAASLAPLHHGTCVLTLSTMDTIVMAADGQVEFDRATGNASSPIEKETAEGTRKIAVCGRRFICAQAGLGPLNYDESGISIHYDFQQWISTIVANEHGSVSDFANAVQKQAQKTFHDMDTILKRDDFWDAVRSHVGGRILIYRVAGFTARGPEFCDISVRVNQENRTLIYGAPDCSVRRTTTGMIYLSTMPGTYNLNSLAAMKAGSPQAAKFLELQPICMVTAKALLPNSPPSLQEIVAKAAALVDVESEFSPENVGGTPSVGILVKGRRPKVYLFAK